MLNRDRDRSSRWSAAGLPDPSWNSEALLAFRRGHRWLNLTLIQQGLWPLLVVVFAAPAVSVGLTPMPWYWARLAGPLLAALLALAYRAQSPAPIVEETREAPRECGRGGREGAGARRRRAAWFIVGVTVMVGIARVIQGPLVPTLKLMGFGLADVAAYQAINFGLVGQWGAGTTGRVWPVALFGLSWGLHDLFLAAATPAVESLALSFISGGVIGLTVGGVSLALRVWPGGVAPAAAFHLLVVYLVLRYLP